MAFRSLGGRCQWCSNSSTVARLSRRFPHRVECVFVPGADALPGYKGGATFDKLVTKEVTEMVRQIANTF